MHTAGESKRYRFRFGAKATLPPEIIVAACLEYAALGGYGTKTLALSRLLYDGGSPGMVFKLTKPANSNRDSISQTGPNTGAAMRIKRNEPPQSAASNKSSATSEIFMPNFLPLPEICLTMKLLQDHSNKKYRA